MRVFVAVDLSLAAREAACAVTRRIRGVSAIANAPIAWTRPRNLHMTLRFLGEIDVGQTRAVSAALARPWRQQAFCVSTDALGVFPPRRLPRVICLGVTGDSEALTSLRAEVDRRLGGCGFLPDAGAFHPHVTVGRVKRTRPAVGAGLRQAVADAEVGVVSWPVDAVVLYESRLSPRGATYHQISRVALQSPCLSSSA